MTLLLAEDDPALGFVLKDSLEAEGYAVVWQTDGEAAWAAFQATPPNLCLLDVMLPRLDGFALAERIRAASDVPIVFLTAKSLKEDRLKGFRLGGDDYLTKPFSIEELVLRIEAIQRRVNGGVVKNGGGISFGTYVFDAKNLKLTGPTGSTDLTQREADLLALLLRRRNEVVPREEILVQIWGKSDYFLGRSLDVFVSRLRKYLATDPSLRVVNVHGVGFRLEV